MIDTDALVAWMDSNGLPGKGEPLEHGYISGGSQNRCDRPRPVAPTGCMWT